MCGACLRTSVYQKKYGNDILDYIVQNRFTLYMDSARCNRKYQNFRNISYIFWFSITLLSFWLRFFIINLIKMTFSNLLSMLMPSTYLLQVLNLYGYKKAWDCVSIRRFIIVFRCRNEYDTDKIIIIIINNFQQH